MKVKKTMKKNMDSILISNTEQDIWTLINSEAAYKKEILFYQFDSCYTLRLLGPLLKTDRLYIPSTCKLSQKISKKEFVEIAKGNCVILDEVCKRIIESATSKFKKSFEDNPEKFFKSPALLLDGTHKSVELRDALHMLDNLANFKDSVSNKWQSCVLSNVFIKSVNPARNKEKIQVAPFTALMFNKTYNSSESGANLEKTFSKKISGLYAHDIIISRLDAKNCANGYNTSFSDKPEYLLPHEINYILEKGLIDLKKIITESNKKICSKMSGYLYRISDYKLEDIYMHSLSKELGEYETNSHIESVEENISQLPVEAFENADFDNAIGSIEL